MQDRDTIFIGHANPEDDDYTIWLQSKLILEGYKCECDRSLLIGGESDFWKDIQEFLEQKTCKYILVLSKQTFKKEGVLDEWEHCKSIERQNSIKDFIIPVKIDNTPYNTRIGLNRKNIIPFEINWGYGLKQLFKKLQNDDVPRSSEIDSPFQVWYENIYTNWSGITEDSNDVFYSNWFKIPAMPPKIYFYQFQNEKQANAVLRNNVIYPAYRHGNYIVTFQKSLDYYLSDKGFEINPIALTSKESKEAFEYFEDSEFPAYHDFRRLLVRLINTCFEEYLVGLDLLTYDLSNSKCYFFQHDPDKRKKGIFYLNDKRKNIGVTGKYYDDFWHYGISYKTLLRPEFCISIKNHIVFTVDGKKAWDNKKKAHAARRKKGKSFHNKEWRDLFLAFMSAIGDRDSKIRIIAAEEEYIELSTTPILFESKFSYIEPNDEERIIPIDSYLEEEDYYEELENATEDD